MIKKEANEGGIDEEVLLIAKDLDPQLLAKSRKCLESKDFTQASEKACTTIVKTYVGEAWNAIGNWRK